jgi:diguanylate cyclase (GGDEF)-like protein
MHQQPCVGPCIGIESAPMRDLKTDARITRREAENAGLFRQVDLDAVWDLLGRCPVRALAPREVLIAAGDVGRDVYVLIEGLLEVRLDPDSKDPVATIEPGQSVGELAPIDHRPRSATIVAAAECRVLTVTEDTFWALLRSSHAFALNVLTMLCDRLRVVDVNLTETQRQRQEYEKQASVDALTGVGNRRWLDELLPRQVHWHTCNGAPLSVIMIDIDHFKRYNDTYGHGAGDGILSAIANLLKTQLRPIDFVARYGGEEFTVVLPCTGITGAVEAAERLRKTVGQTRFPLPDAAQPISVTISLGAAEKSGNEDAEAILSRADQALYRAKREGRDRVCSA